MRTTLASVIAAACLCTAAIALPAHADTSHAGPVLIAAYYADGAVLAAAPGKAAAGESLVRRGADGTWRCMIDNPHNVT